MSNSDQGKEDQRTSSNVDNNAMTVEFLRARLLSERSVSKSARQRADELTKRVSELEEQLRIVSLQRMKAERATADVLAILESNGISDVSDTYDSSSDQDTHCESAAGNNSFREEDHYVNSKMRKHESEGGLVSDLDFSPVPGRSLSWKGCKDSPRSLEKYKELSLRRRNSFASIYSSPKHRTGKSCRQIKRKDSRSLPMEHKTNSIKFETVENVISPTVDGCGLEPDLLGGVVEIRKDKQVQLSGYLENEQNSSGNNHDCNAYDRDRDRDMEKALEHQAELIGKYEEMEKAQREWEEKFRDHNSTLDFCDPGNRSDVTEERYEMKAWTPRLAETIPSQNHDEKSAVQELSNIHPSGFFSSSNVAAGYLQQRNTISTAGLRTAAQDFAFSMAWERQNQEILGNCQDTPSLKHQNHSNSLALHDPSRTVSNLSCTSSSGISVCKANGSESHEDCYALMPHKAANEVDCVLESLRKARLSLQQRINGFPPVCGGFDTHYCELSVPLMIPGSKEGSPVGCAGLFRLPTDFSVEANTRQDFLNSTAGLSLGKYCPDTRFPSATANLLLSSSYLGTRSGISSGDQLLTSRYVNGGSRISGQMFNCCSGLDPALLYFSDYVYPTCSISPPYHLLKPQMPSQQSLSSSLPITNVGIGPANDFLFPDDHVRQNMYRE